MINELVQNVKFVFINGLCMLSAFDLLTKEQNDTINIYTI
jgi:hypothetical protein